MKEYTLKKVNPLGENDPKFGQTFWAETHDQAEPVMFNLVGQNVGEGARISAEIVELKTSGKGTQYHRLKKVKVIGSNPQLTQQPQVPSDGQKVLELILDNTSKTLRLVQALAGEEEKPSLSEAWKQTTGQQADVVVDVDPTEPIDVDDIPF